MRPASKYGQPTWVSYNGETLFQANIAPPQNAKIKEISMGITEPEDMGAVMKALRMRKGLEVKQLAKMAGVSTVLINNAEHGRLIPSGNKLSAIFAELDADISFLIKPKQK